MNQENFELIADSDHINRNESYGIAQINGIEEIIFPNSSTLTVGDKALLYLYQDDFRLYDNFWYILKYIILFSANKK